MSACRDVERSRINYVDRTKRRRVEQFTGFQAKQRRITPQTFGNVLHG